VRLNTDLKCATGLLCLLFCAQSPAQTAGARIGNLLVTQAWSRPTPPTAVVGVVYFSITNLGDKTDRLLALSSPVAAKVELHESHRVQGVLEMRAVSSLQCPPGIMVKSEPGGLHVMLMGLSRPLIAGTAFPISLQFRDAGALTLQVPVENRE
jgi:periplasmic copper chaperone A